MADLEESLTLERDELSANLDKAHRAEMAKCVAQNDHQMETLRNELSEAVTALAEARQSHAEEMRACESSKQHALMMAQQDQTAVSETNKDLSASLDESRRENEQVRREAVNKSDRDRATIQELTLENARSGNIRFLRFFFALRLFSPKKIPGDVFALCLLFVFSY